MAVGVAIAGALTADFNMAGAMLYVVVEELVPDYSQGKHSNIGTIGFALGFAMMMVLDVTLG